MTDVFISWSGERSKEIAEVLRKWIPSVLQFAKPYYTPSDIEKGTKWSSEISKKLADCKVGIVCLTQENYQKPWILFEAGALSKDLSDSRVCSVLFGMDNTDLTGPLTTLQTTVFDKTDFKKMMNTINETGGDRSLAQGTFDDVFDKWWPELQSQIEAILSKERSESKGDIRPDRDLLEEMLLLTRIASKNSKNNEGRALHIPSGLISDLVEVIEVMLEQYSREEKMGEPTSDLIQATKYLMNSSPALRDGYEDRINALRSKFDDIVPF